MTLGPGARLGLYSILAPVGAGGMSACGPREARSGRAAPGVGVGPHTTNDLLPGSRVNQFGRGLDKSDLVRLVDQYNQQQSASARLTLPDEYAFDDRFFTQDVRVTREFPFGRHAARLAVFVELFNALNTANLVGYSGNLTDPRAFGQPTGRFTQVFGSGGPRAVQLGARMTF